MRTFIVRSQKSFDLANPSACRLDLIARCINAAFWLDGGIRTDVEAYFCWADRTLRVDSTIRGVWPDERSILGILAKVLKGRPHRGFELISEPFDQLIARYPQRYWLDRRGMPIESVKLTSPTFILGDASGIVVPQGEKSISIGPKSYLTSHCIVVLNNWVDRHVATS